MITGPRLLFAGDFHWNAGSSHTIAGYARAAPAARCQIGVSAQLSRMDMHIGGHLPLIDDLRWATHLILVFEGRQFLSIRQREMCEVIPRHRRIVLDPDGHWGPRLTRGADDSAGPYGHEAWRSLYRELGDIVLQPKIGSPLPAGAEFFSYFAMPSFREGADGPAALAARPYELQYVGANWWRWDAFADLIEAAHRARPALRRLRVCGRWWTGPQHPDHPAATANKHGWLAEHGVEVSAPVPFGHVVDQMARAQITPILARPLLADMGLLTPRMFETLASGSIPVLPGELAYTTAIYGEHIKHFVLGADPAEDLARLLRDGPRQRSRLQAVRQHLYHRFSYQRVVADLLSFAR